MQAQTRSPNLVWDIFCHVIDNYGDIGVSWRLAVNLAQRAQSVRLWLDDGSALNWLAPSGAPGVTVLPWKTPLDLGLVTPGEVLVEAFGCSIPDEFVASYARQIAAKGAPCLWFNVEYLSAEKYVERSHCLASPVLQGSGKGLSKKFFYPGFTRATGGLLREADLFARQAAFDRVDWLAQHGIAWHGERLVSLFCYEPAPLCAWLDALEASVQETVLLVSAGRAAAAVRGWMTSRNRAFARRTKHGALRIVLLEKLAQLEFDHLLWACDVNFVRGEDSLVRALWAGKPLVWEIYPQADGAQRSKLEAWLDCVQAPASLRDFHLAWNGFATSLPRFEVSTMVENWQATLLRARLKLIKQTDFASALLELVEAMRKAKKIHQSALPTRLGDGCDAK